MSTENTPRTITAALGAGALAGGAATCVMSLTLFWAQRLHLLDRLPPEEMTDKLLDTAGIQAEQRTRTSLAALFHILFGVSAGGLFGLIQRQVRLPLPSSLAGIGYAGMVWLLSYMGWIPALGLLPAATRDGPRRPRIMVLAHAIYGAVLGALVGHQNVVRSRVMEWRRALS